MQIFNTHKIQRRRALIIADGCEGGKEQGCRSDPATASRFGARGEQEICFPCAVSLKFQNISLFPSGYMLRLWGEYNVLKDRKRQIWFKTAGTFSGGVGTSIPLPIPAWITAETRTQSLLLQK